MKQRKNRIVLWGLIAACIVILYCLLFHSGVYLTFERKVYPPETQQVIGHWKNFTTQSIDIGGFFLQKEQNGQWVKQDETDDDAKRTTLPGNRIYPGMPGKEVYSFSMWLNPPLAEGQYRIVAHYYTFSGTSGVSQNPHQPIPMYAYFEIRK